MPQLSTEGAVAATVDVLPGRQLTPEAAPAEPLGAHARRNDGGDPMPASLPTTEPVPVSVPVSGPVAAPAASLTPEPEPVGRGLRRRRRKDSPAAPGLEASTPELGRAEIPTNADFPAPNDFAQASVEGPLVMSPLVMAPAAAAAPVGTAVLEAAVLEAPATADLAPLAPAEAAPVPTVTDESRALRALLEASEQERVAAHESNAQALRRAAAAEQQAAAAEQRVNHAEQLVREWEIRHRTAESHALEVAQSLSGAEARLAVLAGQLAELRTERDELASLLAEATTPDA